MPGEKQVLEIPIFPLPNAILFPRTLMQLHIFEPRYRRMVADCLQADPRLLGIALLQPGLESDKGESPQVFEIGGMGEIANSELLEDGRYNIWLQGSSRFRIRRFLSDSLPYRRAEVELMPETLPDPMKVARPHRFLLRCLAEMAKDENDKLDLSEVARLDFQTLLNRICAFLRIPVSRRQGLLEIGDLQARTDAVVEILKDQAVARRFSKRFGHLRPKDASVN